MSRIIVNFFLYSDITPFKRYFMYNKNLFLKNNFFLKHTSIFNITYYDYIVFLNYNFWFSRKMYFFSQIFLNCFKNFSNIYYNFVFSGVKVLTLDSQYNFFNVVTFNQLALIKYNYFFNLNNKIFKNQHFFIFFKNFIVNNHIHMVVIFDFEFYCLYLNFFNFLNVYTFSFVTPTYNAIFLDFFIYKTSFFNQLEKIVYYFYFYNIYNVATAQKFLFLKKNFIHKFYKLQGAPVLPTIIN